MTPSETSREAHESVKPTLPNLQQQVFKTLMSVSARPGPDGNPQGGATDEEMESLLGMKHQTVSARRRELVLRGLVEPSGNRRKTSSGRSATVWQVTALGLSYYLGGAR